MTDSIAPHGGTLRQLLAAEDRAEALKLQSIDFASVTLTQRQICDLELLLNGGFSPLTGFMTRAVYEGVVADMRLPDGLIWPIPVTLDIADATAQSLSRGDSLALRDTEGFMLAVLEVEDVWLVDKQREARAVYGTDSLHHPGVRYLYEQTGGYFVGGTLLGVQLPTHFDYEELRHSPAELRRQFAKMGWRRVVSYQTSEPMHRFDYDLTMRAAKLANGHILLQPAAGETKPGDLSYYARVKCYQAIEKHYPHGLSTLSLLPIALRMAGPREALWHALVAQNFGCSHFIVGLDCASPPPRRGNPQRFYAPDAAQALVRRHEDELGIRMLPFGEHVYVASRREFVPVAQVQAEKLTHETFSSASLAERLSHDRDIPPWFSFPEVIEALRQIHPPRSRQGITLFFTGLSGSGKSTLARIIYGKFIEEGSRPVTLLDGDIVRRNLSSELGFSKAHRDLNVRRIGFVASEITKNGGVAICAPIAPYALTRKAVRELVEQSGAFIEIYVATPLEICEQRDRKGLYAKARRGLIPEFTGISDPYEVPDDAEIELDTTQITPMEAAQEIYLYLLREGYFPMATHGPEPGLA